jgi:hypothetical protein
MRPSRLCVLVGVAPCLPSALATSPHFPIVSDLWKRDTACSGLSNLTTCGSSYPSSWCCPTNTQCLPLNNTGTQSVICCPDGNACDNIQTITCDISFQDPSKYPDSAIHIANLSVALPVCGSQCCPLGYACQSDDQGQFCRILDSTTSPPTTSAAPGLASSSKFPLPSSTASPQAGSSTKQSSNTKFIIAAIIPVLVALALFVGCMGYWTRRKVKVNRQISEPIYDPQRAARSDFLNRYVAPRRSVFRPLDTLASTSMRPATADSSKPLADQPIDMQVRTVYPPTQRPLSGRLSMAERASPSLASTPPSHSDSYSSRLLPAVPVNPLAPKNSRSSGDKLPDSRYEPGRK